MAGMLLAKLPLHTFSILGTILPAPPWKVFIMALISCPECGKEISDKALFCPACGFSRRGAFYCFEYRSKTTWFGLPLLHVVLGPPLDPSTRRLRVAKEIIAIGGIAVGFLSLGDVSFGLISLGGLAIGLIAIGGAAIGYYAFGGGAWGAHSLGGYQQDSEAVVFFKRYLGSWIEKLEQGKQT
jgi:hypothetical protein